MRFRSFARARLVNRATLVGGALVGLALVGCRDSAGDTSSSTDTTTDGDGGGSSTATASVTGTGGSGVGGAGSGGSSGSGGSGGGGGGAPFCATTPAECGAVWEQNASDAMDALVANDPGGLLAFFTAMPKGADLHHHLSGAVYAETYLDWAKQDGMCINTSTYAAVSSGQCSATALPVPAPGTFYDSIVRAWSMKDFVPGGAESGHDHFFATFGKFGSIAGQNRNESLADIATRASDENQQYVETMFNLGNNIGNLSVAIWAGTLTEADLPGLYDDILADPTFATELSQDVAVVDSARTQYRAVLGCSGTNPPAACDVDVRFIAQVSRTGGKDKVFGQLISAFEMASVTPTLVGANLSSPEDDTTSLNNYMLHMAMLDFLHDKYKTTGLSPLHITLHAGEVTPEFLPVGSNHNTFHIRQAVDLGHAERIGHGVDVLSETNAQDLLDDMAQLGVLVETCMSSNAQILEISGAAHPLTTYIANGVPVALATDDQGVSRSSLAGEFVLATLDQDLDYRQLKRMARDSLEHAFLPGDSLWNDFSAVDPVSECQVTATMGLGDTPNATCQTFLDGSERAAMQWELERRFRVFESQQ